MSSSNIGNLNAPAVPQVGPASNDGAVDAYQRAIGARPTTFSENPIGAMAQAMDKLGRAAGSLLGGSAQSSQTQGGGAATSTQSQSSLQQAESTLIAADQAASANPSTQASQNRLTAALGLYNQMQQAGFSQSDPRVVRVATLAAQLANQLGADKIPFNTPGLDVRGLLGMVAQTIGKYGDANGMQLGMSLAALLKATLGASDAQAQSLLDALIDKFGLSQAAAKLLANNWRVLIAPDNEMPSLDAQSRTLVLSESQESQDLAVLARAYWNDASGASAGDKDGFIKAFLGIAGSGAFGLLQRKYKDVRTLAKSQLAQQMPSAIGAITDQAVTGVATGGQSDDDSSSDSSDMFAALAQFHAQDSTAALPADLASPLAGFMK